jgi:hypothetical protein
LNVRELLNQIKPYVLGWCGGYSSGTFNPSFTNLTVTGSPVATGRFTQIGKLAYYRVLITANGGTTASAGGTTYCDMPLTVAYDNACAVVDDTTLAVIASPTGWVRAANSKLYTPTWTASGANFIISGWFETT